MANITDVEIANLALYRAGSNLRLTSIDDQTSDGKLIKSLYQFTRDLLLRQYPWNFAMRTKALALIDDEDSLPPGWLYQYTYPVDCAFARQVCDANGARQTWYQVVPGQLPVQWLQPKIPFTVSTTGPFGSNEEYRKVILTDLTEAYLVYTGKVKEAVFDEAFVSACASRLAMDLVTPLHCDARMYDKCARQFAYEVSQAFSLSANESMRDTPPESPAIMARN